MKKTLLTLARDTALVYGAQMAGVLMGLVVSILVARVLGPDGRGAYAWIMTMHLFGVQLGLLGADTMYRRLAAHRPQVAPTLAANGGIQSLAGGLLTGAVVMAVCLVQPVGESHPMGTLLGMLAIPGAMLVALANGLAVGLGQAKMVAINELSQRVMIVAMVGLVFLFSGTLTLNSLMAAVFAALTVTGLLAAWHRVRRTPLPWVFSARLWWHERFMLVGALGSGMATFGLQKLDLVMLGAWRPLAESGYYAVAQTLMDASLILPATLGFLMLSRLAALETRAERRLMLLRLLGVMLAGFAVVALVAAWLGQWIIPLLFGQPFVEAVPVFHVLMASAVAGAAFLICQNAAAGIGRVRYVMAGPAVGVAVKVLAGLALIPGFGMMGAAWGNMLAYAAAALVALGVAWTGSRHLPPEGPVLRG